MRVVLAGSPEVAVTTLDALLAARRPEFEVVGVISQPARPVGRKKIITPTPLAQAAEGHGLPCLTPDDPRGLVDALQQLQPDLAVAVAYGRMIGEEARAVPRHGWWNVHFSLLPAHRGATPVQHALLAGDRRTGVTIFQIDEGLDTGDIVAQASHQIEPFVTAGELLSELAEIGGGLLVDTLVAEASGSLERRVQDGEASLAPKLPRKAGRLDFSDPVNQVFRRWQAVTPEPGAHTTVRGKDGALAILRARPAPDVVDLEPGQVVLRESRVLIGCARGALDVTEVQPAGKKPMSAADWLRGAGSDVVCGD